MASPKMDTIIDKFNVFTEKPVKFLSVQKDLKDDIKNLVKSIYDFTKVQEKGVKRQKKGALPELIIEDLDEEQIWQEIELQNNECWDQLVWEVANCMTLKDEIKFPVEISTDQDKNEDVNKLQSNKKSVVKINKQSNQTAMLKATKKKKDKSNPKVKASIVDDQFFKLQEMEQFLLSEERNEGKKAVQDSDDESIDLFDDIETEEEDEEENGARNVKYSSFFDETEDGDLENDEDDISSEVDEDGLHEDELEVDDDEIDSKVDENSLQGRQDEFDDNESLNEDHVNSNNTKNKDKKVRFADATSSDDNSDLDVNDTLADDKTVETPNEKMSEFERRQERLQKTIQRLEEKTLNEAPWQLKGEVDASKRPQNSLLEEVVDFDLTTRPAPIITEQTTLTLEDIIRQRIKDKAWDDVEKKEKPVDDQLSFRKTEILDHAKSKLSLAQVYEAEYLKQKQALSGDVEEEKEPEAHIEIRDAMSQLFAKLDALCHYHYTPKAAQAEVKIVTNTPAISMEEVAPIATSDATLLAPEEVKKKRKGELMTKEERTQTDKNRERRKKKKFQRAKGGHVAKITDHRNTKKGIEANDKSLKTSKAFFQQLNDDTSSLIKTKSKNVKFGKNKVK